MSRLSIFYYKPETDEKPASPIIIKNSIHHKITKIDSFSNLKIKTPAKSKQGKFVWSRKTAVCFNKKKSIENRFLFLFFLSLASVYIDQSLLLDTCIKRITDSDPRKTGWASLFHPRAFETAGVAVGTFSCRTPVILPLVSPV